LIDFCETAADKRFQAERELTKLQIRRQTESNSRQSERNHQEKFSTQKIHRGHKQKRGTDFGCCRENEGQVGVTAQEVRLHGQSIVGHGDAYPVFVKMKHVQVISITSFEFVWFATNHRMK